MASVWQHKLVMGNRSDLEAKLNEAGLEGWEAVAMHIIGWTYIVLVKRKLPDSN